MRDEILGVLLLVFFITAHAASAETCLSTEQVASLTAITGKLNLSDSDKSAFMSIFDSLCGRSYTKNETDSKIGEIGNVTDIAKQTAKQEITNYTQWFEERESISESISRMADIVNASSNIKKINEETDRKLNEYMDTVDARLEDWKEEKKNFIDKEELNQFRMNMTGMIISMRNEAYRSTAGQQNWYIIGLAAVAVIGFAGYQKWKSSMRRERIMSSSPKYERRSPIPEEQKEEIMAKLKNDQIKKTQEEQIAEEVERLKGEMEEERREAELKKRLKRK